MKAILVLMFNVLTVTQCVGAEAPKLDLNDVTWLWPVPHNPQELEEVISIDSLKSADGTDVWSDQQFSDLIKVAASDASRVEDHQIHLPKEVRTKAVWRIVAFRADPTAPGGHEIIRSNFGEKPQLRLVLQPVTMDGDKIVVHDIAIHLVYDFLKQGEGGTEDPDRDRFQQIVRGLDQLKAWGESHQVTTTGRPLGVHPGLKAKVPGLRGKVRDFLAMHLRSDDLSAMALMGLDGPEPWIFIAMSKFPPGATNFEPVSFLPAQMLSFRKGPGVILPIPIVNNLNDVPSRFPMPANAEDRRGVATAALFADSTLVLDELAITGVDEAGQPIRDSRIRNRDIPDIIADPKVSHFFNTDCLSCHTETRRRMRFSLEPGKFAYLHDGQPPQIDPQVLPQHDWNVRNLGWFPPSRFIGGGPTVPTVTQRTANETAEVVEFIEQYYRHDVTPEVVGAAAPIAKSHKVRESPTTGETRFDELSETPTTGKTRYLDQGWTPDERENFYYATQGSQLLPYLWFLSLEQSQNNELLRSESFLASLGCIPQSPSHPHNPDGLPIGFVKNSSRIPIEEKRALLGPEFDKNEYPSNEEWLGFTCAACHTAEIAYEGKKIRIDGGAALFDLESFLAELANSMRATATDDNKFARFEQTLQQNSPGDMDTTGLREELTCYTPVIEGLVARNKADHPYGLARLDAFGAILNQICAGALGIPENHRPSNAPVSYPFLWDTPQLDWVQWNSSVDIPVARNVGEVLGVFAHVKLTGTPEDGQFGSSANPQNLHRLEVQLRRLRALEWPQDLFGEIDEQQAALGKALFTNRCANCHNTRDETGNFAMTEPNEFGHSFIRTTSVPFKKIGTDPLMVTNFITRTALPGNLAGLLKPQFESPEGKAKLKQRAEMIVALGRPRPDFTQEVPADILLSGAVSSVINLSLEPELRNRTESERREIMLDLKGYRSGGEPPHGGAGYKARPLNGVWATAPFGHAGAVPSLYQWLLPQEKRIKKFSISDRDFDTKHVGFDTKEVAGAFEFNTVDADNNVIPGNSNQGHSSKDQTDFTEEQRWQLIEYMKTLQ